MDRWRAGQTFLISWRKNQRASAHFGVAFSQFRDLVRHYDHRQFESIYDRAWPSQGLPHVSAAEI